MALALFVPHGLAQNEKQQSDCSVISQRCISPRYHVCLAGVRAAAPVIGPQGNQPAASTGKGNGIQEGGKVVGKGKADKKARKEPSEPAAAVTKVGHVSRVVTGSCPG